MFLHRVSRRVVFRRSCPWRWSIIVAGPNIWENAIDGPRAPRGGTRAGGSTGGAGGSRPPRAPERPGRGDAWVVRANNYIQRRRRARRVFSNRMSLRMRKIMARFYPRTGRSAGR